MILIWWKSMHQLKSNFLSVLHVSSWQLQMEEITLLYIYHICIQYISHQFNHRMALKVVVLKLHQHWDLVHLRYPFMMLCKNSHHQI